MVLPLNDIRPDMFDEALHSGPRITIMTRLVIHGPMRFGALRKSTGLTDGNLASHLSVLQTAGYVIQDRDERHATPTKQIAITAAGDEAFRTYLTNLKALIASMSRPTASSYPGPDA